MDTGVARRPIIDMEAYELSLKARMDPTATSCSGIHARARAGPGADDLRRGRRPARAARRRRLSARGPRQGPGRRPRGRCEATSSTAAGLADAVRELEVVNAANTPHLETYKEFLYDRLQRKGFDQHDIHRLGAARPARLRGADAGAWAWRRHGHRGDAQVGHVMEPHQPRLRRRAPSMAPSASPRFCTRGAIVLIADTLVHEWPDERGPRRSSPNKAAGVARNLGLEPRVAFVSLLDLRLSGLGTRHQDARGARGAGPDAGSISNTRAR